MERRFLFRLASALTIAGVTAGLLVHLSGHHLRPTSPAPALSPAPSVAPKPANFAGVDMTSPPQSAPLPASNGKPSPRWTIAFTRGEYGQTPEIWTANVDGTDKRRILENADTPCWSPDRTRLAFARDGNVWVATPDGGRQWQVTFWAPNAESLREIHGISWDPRDHLISFSRDESLRVSDPEHAIGGDVGDVDGTAIFHASLLPGRIFAELPFVRPHPISALEFRSEEQDSDPLFLPNYDLSRGFANNTSPAWSRRADRFAFARNGDLWLAERVEPEAGGLSSTEWFVYRLIACGDIDDGIGYGDHFNVAVTHVAWSPDGKSLLYTLARIDGGGFAETHLVRLGDVAEYDFEGRAKTHDSCVGDGGSCSFSPDGKWILTTERRKWIAESLDTKKSYPIPIDGRNLVW